MIPVFKPFNRFEEALQTVLCLFPARKLTAFRVIIYGLCCICASLTITLTAQTHLLPVIRGEYSRELSNPWPGKCTIKNFENLKRSSIVYTWVNGSDPCYRDIRQRFGGPQAVGGSRDRQIGELKYSLRSLLKYAPWLEGDIYIVTPGHIPSFVDISHPRIHIIDQDDLIPPSQADEVLPTFNTNAIEQFLYRIPGLTDTYIQINDDYIFASDITPHDFFTCDGGIRIFREENIVPHKKPDPKGGIWLTSVLHTQEVLDNYLGITSRKYLKHAPFVLSRPAYARIHQIFDEELRSTARSKFRSRTDLNIPLVHMSYMMEKAVSELGLPAPEAALSEEMAAWKLYVLKDGNKADLRKVYDSILSGEITPKCFALNDEYRDMSVANQTVEFLDALLPNPSAVERVSSASLVPQPPSLRSMERHCIRDSTVLPPLRVFATYHSEARLVGFREVVWLSLISFFLKGIVFGLGVLSAVHIWSYCAAARDKGATKRLKYEPVLEDDYSTKV